MMGDKRNEQIFRNGLLSHDVSNLTLEIVYTINVSFYVNQ
jgi:hypothetical protein